MFHALKAFLPGTTAGASYEDTARALGTNCDAVKTAVHRLRKEFGQRLRSEVRRTVSTSAELQEELAHLLAVLNAAD